MIALRRAAVVAVACTTSLLACNALTGIGEYAVETGDATVDGAPGPGDASIDAYASPDGDAASQAAEASCAIVDHPARTGDDCEQDVGNVGPAMASLQFGFQQSHCIDETEVTVDDYRRFLAERGATNTCGQPAECAWNTTYAPAANDPPDASTPQVNVDWCDAFMYCRWAGKHLCGQMGFTSANGDTPPRSVPSEFLANSSIDLWYAFCGGSGVVTYSHYFYGDVSMPGTCEDGNRPDPHLAAVRSLPACHGTDSSTRVFDMIGNAAEWEWSCDSTDGNAPCRVRGGSFMDKAPDTLACASAPTAPRNTTSPLIGFRCCVE